MPSPAREGDGSRRRVVVVVVVLVVGVRPPPRKVDLDNSSPKLTSRIGICSIFFTDFEFSGPNRWFGRKRSKKCKIRNPKILTKKFI